MATATMNGWRTDPIRITVTIDDVKYFQDISVREAEILIKELTNSIKDYQNEYIERS